MITSHFAGADRSLLCTEVGSRLSVFLSKLRVKGSEVSQIVDD